MSTRARALAALGVLVLVGAAGVGLYLKNWRAETHRRWDLITVGDSEEYVRSTLGTPTFEYEYGNVPEVYYVEGYGRRERPVTGKVLIYLNTDMILYVWVDRHGRVEEIFRGTS
jgi:outer membrane protein assembly factor BamE (lipoprotein component of BamABCDE complex)